jgi:cytochrome c oxidase assembly protein subunit 15
VSSWHAAIEQINRLLTGVVAASVVVAVLASFLVQPVPRFARDLSTSLVVGVLVQVVIGAYVVWTGLNPWSNMVHFLVSAVLVVLATLLVRLSGEQTPPQAHDWNSKRYGLLFGVATAVAVVTGTVVTGSGPHAGDENAIRLGFSIRDVVRVHGAAVWTALAVILMIAVVARRHGAKALYGSVSLVIGAFLAQGFVGYVQYFAGIPAALVALHIAGSVLVTVTVTNLVAQLIEQSAPSKR